MSQKAWIATLSSTDAYDYEHFTMWADAFAQSGEFLGVNYIFYCNQSKAPEALPMVPNECILVGFTTEGSYAVDILLDKNIKLYSKISYFPDLPTRYPRSAWGSESSFNEWIQKYCVTLTSPDHVRDQIKVNLLATQNGEPK